MPTEAERRRAAGMVGRGARVARTPATTNATTTTVETATDAWLNEFQNRERDVNDNIRHRDEQPAVQPEARTLHRVPRPAFVTAEDIPTPRDQARNKVSKRKKSLNGPQYNRIRSASTI